VAPDWEMAMSHRSMLQLATWVSLLLWTACADTFISGDGGIPDGGGGSCTKEGEKQCSGQRYEICQDGVFVTKDYCSSPQVCSVAVGGCAQCEPGGQFCVGDELHSCDSSGKAGALLKTCNAGFCVGGTCTDPCTQAQGRRSYVGCSYWPTVTSNSQVSSDFSFAVVVANTYEEPAQITVSTASNPSVAKATVPGGSVATITLPWVKNLKGVYGEEKSVLEPNGAYHLVSSLPVTVYQFNALDYVLNHDCTDGSDTKIDGKCYSYSNDASLLLPDHALEKEYVVVSRPTLATIYETLFGTSLITSPGFFTVTAPKPGDTKVTVTFSANTQAGVGSLVAYSKGQTVDFTIPYGGVLQILSRMPTSTCTPTTSDATYKYCDMSSDSDLTATVIKADKEIAVFGGHNCAFVPYAKWACDHLEEQIFPVKTWGKHYFATHPSSSGTDPAIYRVISADNGNQITFNPADVQKAPVVLDEGKFTDITTTKDVEITGTGRLLVVQYMVGQNYSNLNPGEGAPGDPAMSLAVAVEQYRTDYRFLAPKSYEQNFVNVIAPSSASISLDDAFVAESKFTAIGTTSFKSAKLAITGGSHRIHSTVAFGITVYGVGAYTSYMYPGGLDLKILLD
jgi:hypothetical protein